MGPSPPYSQKAILDKNIDYIEKRSECDASAPPAGISFCMYVCGANTLIKHNAEQKKGEVYTSVDRILGHYVDRYAIKCNHAYTQVVNIKNDFERKFRIIYE